MTALPKAPASKMAVEPSYKARFAAETLDRDDPDMWLTLYLDSSVPIDDEAKAALLTSQRRFTRRRLHMFVRPLARCVLAAGALFRAVVPNRLAAPRFLHWMLARGLRRWVAPEANWLILRHFHIGSEVLQFIKDNVPAAKIETMPLKPRRVEDLAEMMFLRHDLNLFNLVGQLGAHLRRTGQPLRPPARLDFSAITDGAFDIEPPPAGRLNFVDLQTAVEAYTPTYQLFLRDDDFWRASTSLQLDETIAVHVARLTGDERGLAFCQNGHPLLPLPTLGAGWRLMLHGLAAEQLHYKLRLMKRQAAKAVAPETAPELAPEPAALPAREH